MGQILEQEFEKKKEGTRIPITATGFEKRQNRLRKPTYPIKLSEIWREASKELKQLKVEFGDPSLREACAMGAISYYLSEKETCLLSELKYAWQKAVFRDMVKTFESKTKSSIWALNDVEDWTFKDFADKALELGL